jgi:hypothetical protein
MGPLPIANNGTPFANIDKSLISSTYAGGFNSLSEMNNQYGLAGTSNNISAIKMSGGSGINNIKRKIKNIANSYKMRKGRKMNFRSMKKRITNLFSLGKSKTRRTRRRGSRSRRMRGGENLPYYSVGDKIGSSNLGMANPPPIIKH